MKIMLKKVGRAGNVRLNPKLSGYKVNIGEYYAL
jgi:hypothetical protein